MNSVFVLDAERKQLLPTHPARARKLLNYGKATVHEVVPFTIRLKRIVDNPVGSFTVGIDDGAKEAGIAIVNDKTKEVVFKGTIKLRQDVKRKMLQRAGYRRARRSRKLRHRKLRFLNRGKTGWLPPTIKQKKESILRVVDDLKKRVNIVGCVIEQGQFDTSSMSAGYKLTGKEYQLSQYEGHTWRQKVFWRDRYMCQKCSAKSNLQAHHIVPRSQGGTNTVSNGLTLCVECHDSFHKGVWVTHRKPKHFRYPAHLQQGKWYLFNELKMRFQTVKICYGWMTAYWRKTLSLDKTHFNDAISMVCKAAVGRVVLKDFLIQPKRRKIWENNPTKKHTEKNGFRHYDLVKAKHRTKGIVIGCVRSLQKMGLGLRTVFDSNFHVSYNKSRLIWRFDNILYI